MDEKKIQKTKEMGITLIHVPYWWDKEISSLKATIASVRPELINISINDNNSIIPTKLPVSSKKNKEK